MSRSSSASVTALACLAVALIMAQRGTGGTGDPTVAPAGDPHHAISAMSKASEPDSKGHETATIPNVVPSGKSGGEAFDAGAGAK